MGGRAVRVVRGRLRRRRVRRGRPGDDPDRQLDRRPGRGHPPLPARLRAAHHRGTSCGSVLPDGGARVEPGHDQHRAQPRARARQCRKIIRKHGLKPVIAGDTAGAAREVAEFEDPSQAAISPPLAAEIYGLEILAEDVEDEEHNTTRFVVLSRELVEAPPGNGPVVTSFIFNVRNLPGLYKALGGFATNGVNMTKLESYMVGGHFTATQFLAEVDGHPDDLRVKRARWRLAFFTTDVKILGVYPLTFGPDGRPTRLLALLRRRVLHQREHAALRVGEEPSGRPPPRRTPAPAPAADALGLGHRVVHALHVEVDVPVRGQALGSSAPSRRRSSGRRR